MCVCVCVCVRTLCMCVCVCKWYVYKCEGNNKIQINEPGSLVEGTLNGVNQLQLPERIISCVGIAAAILNLHSWHRMMK